MFADSNCLSGYAVAYDCVWTFPYILRYDVARCDIGRQITLGLTEYTWLNNNMKLSYDYSSSLRSNQSLEAVSAIQPCKCKEGTAPFRHPETVHYNYSRYETREKIKLWKYRTDTSFEVMYIKMTESLSIGKITTVATTIVVIILICIYSYRRQRRRAERRQIEMVWVKVRHSLFV